jgi:hypothetical protein
VTVDSPRRILFVTPPCEDYLAVTLLHGLRSIYGAAVVDYPRYDVAYEDYPVQARTRVYGRGFSVFFLLPEVAVDRRDIEERVAARQFDLVVFSDIWRTFELFARWRPYLDPGSTVLVDGSDSAQVYPHAGYWWRRPRYWRLPRATTGFLYFKREWTENSQFNLWHRLIPTALLHRKGYYAGLRPIAFSFPAQKILPAVAEKRKDFPTHIVDHEVVAVVAGSRASYAFSTEAEYYADLQQSRFGITTKRAGWDCLRHYEIAANGCVPCFRQLSDKPTHCAPHGLVPGRNCIDYRDAADLLHQTRSLSARDYDKLAAAALAWARQNSTTASARGLVSAWENHAL